MAKQVGCPTEITLEAISGRWKVMVIYWLLQGDRRFNRLQRDLAGITHRTLAKQLKEMEATGLIERRDFRETPLRVEYRLTPLGRSLEPILLAMHDWAVKYDPRVGDSNIRPSRPSTKREGKGTQKQAPSAGSPSLDIPAGTSRRG